jgi:hypothetical protein
MNEQKRMHMMAGGAHSIGSWWNELAAMELAAM